MCPPPPTAVGLYARIKVRPPPDCVLRRLSEQHVVTQFTPGEPDGHRTQVVLDTDSDDVVSEPAIDDCVRLGEWIVCRLAHADSDSACKTVQSRAAAGNQFSLEQRHHEMLLYGFGQLPVRPVSIRLVDGWAELHLVPTAYPKLRETVSVLRETAFDVDLRQVVQSDRAPESAVGGESRLSVVDLSTLTDRQREVATVALGSGYFESDGATASEVAATLKISKSTLSEHLRIVIRKILSQVMP